MNRLTSLVFGVGLALVSIGMAHAEGATGAWKLTVGVNDVPCTLTLTANASGTAGSIASGADCPSGLYTVSNWKAAGNGIELYSDSGELIASLKPKGDSFVGTRFADGRKLALNR